ncbi:hypothetical protein FQR65_LT13601 [Abscondita terminalis]|nr:hypothetical protein FQR65_LT13601 [Abscondita terminalis]
MFNLETIFVSLATAVFIWMLLKNLKEIQVQFEEKRFLLGFLLFLPFFILSALVTIVVSGIFWIFRKLLSLLLKLKLGDDFYNLVENFDVYHTMEKTEFSFIHILLVVECDELTGNGLYEWSKKPEHVNKMKNNENLQKLFCTLETCMGYSYYRKVSVASDDCILKLPVKQQVTELENVELAELLGESFYNPMPKKNTMLWDIQIGTQPLKSESINKKKYPVLFRVHHVIADGVALAQLWLNIFPESNVEIVEVPKSISSLVERNHLRQIVGMIFETIILFPSLMYTSLYKKSDKNYLDGKNNIKKENLAFDIDKDGKYFQKVKAIKQKCPQISFSDIILTACSASLRDCLSKNTTSRPTYITGLIPVITNFDRLLQMNSKKVTLINQYAGLQMKVPVFIDNHKDYMIDYPLVSRLKMVNKLLKCSKTPSELTYKTLLPFLGGLLPTSLLKFVVSQMSFTTAFSILPGSPKVSLNEPPISLSNCLFWLPHLQNIGVTFSVTTYNNQLDLALNCNGSLGFDNETVSGMIRNAYEYLDLLDVEIDKYQIQN